ncbi:hypothetical protein I203_107887 [Kwoniella mangroviensis CBS 8507]|uniref:hypothetical protein n=1 Tax=Kwoniella mangroviensis CBS 8507 TaxID=1296122 RepID=UPI00080D7E7D|nr:uncharacterized protein I203_04781 [Kwoniella mangroviensis CBS 8507]OCF65763.1 hypothetical protein I203_04781 [Kwoniella mangroviensis CBS 8507]
MSDVGLSEWDWSESKLLSRAGTRYITKISHVETYNPHDTVEAINTFLASHEREREDDDGSYLKGYIITGLVVPLTGEDPTRDDERYRKFLVFDSNCGAVKHRRNTSDYAQDGCEVVDCIGWHVHTDNNTLYDDEHTEIFTRAMRDPTILRYKCNEGEFIPGDYVLTSDEITELFRIEQDDYRRDRTGRTPTIRSIFFYRPDLTGVPRFKEHRYRSDHPLSTEEDAQSTCPELATQAENARIERWRVGR